MIYRTLWRKGRRAGLLYYFFFMFFFLVNSRPGALLILILAAFKSIQHVEAKSNILFSTSGRGFGYCEAPIRFACRFN